MHFARQSWNPCSKKAVCAFRQEGHEKREMEIGMWADNRGFPPHFLSIGKILLCTQNNSRKFLTIK